MINEKQLTEFENQIANDKLNAFKDMLSTYHKQKKVIESLQSQLKGFKSSLEKYAEEAHYKVNWDDVVIGRLTVKPFENIGDCMRCQKKNIGILKYSDFKGGYFVCEHCYDKLCDEFDEEYK